MSDIDQNGLPTENEFTWLESFEDRLVNAVEHDEQSVLAAALTCNGEKEFVFYSKHVGHLLSRLTKMPQDGKRYPISIQRYDDPDWSYFYSILPDHS